MRVNAAGYIGEPVSLMCSFDPSTDILAVVKKMPAYEDSDRAGYLRVTTQERDAAHDAVFLEDDTRDAILAYFDMRQMGHLNLVKDMASHQPENSIEREGMDEHGMKFRVKPEITNAQFAVLVACFYAKKQREVAAIGEVMQDMAFYSI
jgi:hypothetical protein